MLKVRATVYGALVLRILAGARIAVPRKMQSSANFTLLCEYVEARAFLLRAWFQARMRPTHNSRTARELDVSPRGPRRRLRGEK